MKNLSIKFKIMIAFAFLLLTIGLMGGIAYYSISKLENNMADVGRNYLPSVKATA